LFFAYHQSSQRATRPKFLGKMLQTVS